MEITLHKLARTTPAIRLEIQQSKLTYKELARKFGVSVDTIYRWKKRDNGHDRSHARKNLLSSLSSVEEHIVVELRKSLDLSLDDITEVMKRCINPDLSRSSIYRAMKRCGVAKRPPRAGLATPQQFEETTEAGYIHMDVKYLTKLGGK
jgi:transposase